MYPGCMPCLLNNSIKNVCLLIPRHSSVNSIEITALCFTTQENPSQIHQLTFLICPNVLLHD
uniref:Uncharacterized protein n=1 Tax=Anguilla anguilla TaxID=7936 RepID=A0A0E9PI81_ANGAN